MLAALQQKEREQVAQAAGTEVGLSTPPPLSVLPLAKTRKKREKHPFPQKSVFSQEVLRNLNLPQRTVHLTQQPGQLWRNSCYQELDHALEVVCSFSGLFVLA